MTPQRFDVAVIGSGFAGSLLARTLARMGRRVLLLERSSHPRFALGESSTPLAAICLERLARRHGFDDLHHLAAWGRWRRHLPELRRGLKRGFTFFRHRAGERFENGPANEHRLLVAASPDDEVADSHWLREDVDRHLVEQAVAEGVDYRDHTEVEGLRRQADGWRLEARRRGRSLQVGATTVVDGSGAGGVLARAVPIESIVERVELDTALVFGHFADVGSFVAAAEAGGARLDSGPYPDERAAVHHLLEEGWMYVLPFDHGVVSAGILLRGDVARQLESAGSDCEALWRRLLDGYPTLRESFARARPLRPLAWLPRVQRRLARASGADWALLPHTFAFFDPMFSTGIAWSLLAVERLASVFEEATVGERLEPARMAAGLERYGRLLQDEARQMLALLRGAYLAMGDFDLFVSHSFLYFATVSFEEVLQRLDPVAVDGTPPAWRGFLGAGDEVLETVYAEALRRLTELASRGGSRQRFHAWVGEAIAPRNVAGLADPRRRNLYPVDLDLLVERAALLGRTAAELRANLHRLRGF